MKLQDRFSNSIKKYKLRSVYARLVGMVVLLTTAVSLVSAAILLLWYDTMIDSEKAAQKLNLEYVIESFNEAIGNAYQTIYSVAGDNTIIDHVCDYDRRIDTYEENSSMEDIISRIYLVYNADEAIRNIFIAHTQNAFVIDQNGISDFSPYFKNRFGENAAYWEELAKGQHTFSLQMNNDGDSLYVLYSLRKRNVPFATLFVELDIYETYKKTTLQEVMKNYIVGVADAQGNIIGYLSEKQDDALLSQVIEKGDLEGHLVFNVRTSAKELSIIAFAPLRLLTERIILLVWISILFLVVTIILGSIAAICIARHIYRPLYRAVELIEIAGDHGGSNELEVLENNVGAILEYNHSMTAVVAQSTPFVLEAMFRRLIMEADDEKEFDEMLEMLSIEVRNGYYMTVVFYAEEEVEDAIDVLFSDNIISLFKRHKDEYVLVLYLQEEETRKIMADKCKGFLQKVDAVVAMGKMYKELYYIGKSYHDAIEVLGARNVSMSAVKLFDAGVPYIYTGYELPRNIESILYNCILSGKSTETVETVREILRKNIHRDISFKGYQQLLEVCETYLTRVYANMDIARKEKIMLEKYEGENYSFQGLERRAEMMLDNYLRMTTVYSEKQQSDVMDRILQYIEDHIEQDIGLSDVADFVNLTPNYLTKYFKEKCGINFKSFLTMKRMERAKELLVETRMTVKDVAAKCGYNSSKQFIVNFTKATGVTPTDYRKCHGHPVE